MGSPTSTARRVLRRLANFRGRRVADLLYSVAWKLGARFRAPSAVHEAVFTRIYEHNEWGSAESRSGPGSTSSRGNDIAASLVDVFDTFSIAVLLDAPCGDFNWMRHLTGRLESYVGVDIVRDLIARNNEQYADHKHRFLCRDITCDDLPPADAVLCRDALVHLSDQDVWAAIANFKRTGAEYLLATTFADVMRNDDIRTGGWRALNLQIAPFNFPEPIAVIRDVPSDPAWNHPGKKLGVWRLRELPMGR